MFHYLIGIDLGTTNSAVAAIDARRKSRAGLPEIATFEIPQLVQAGQISPRPLLPSFLYLPGGHDLPEGSLALPWDPQRRFAVGEFARNHGSKIPGRLVTSAKSWLCHAGVDRTAALLPWSAPPDVARISPVEAALRYLKHMAEAWNHLHPSDPFEKQAIVLTVPASFDDVARTLTVEAARQAGLENVTLLEEPQAAFYCWLATHSASAVRHLKPDAACLVVDVGGGTSDFSLIRTVEQQGELAFVRDAVGDHLLLGGDNMDLALAKCIESRLPGAPRLDATQYGMLTQACRLAKEVLLAPQAPQAHTVTVMGRGRQVIGGTLHANLTAQDVQQILFDGFFPTVPADATPTRGGRTGLHEMGLPYVNDPAITRHLAAFLHRHAAAGASGPQAILFNGGVFQPAALRQRLVQVLRPWFDRPDHPWQPLVLSNPSLDLAVAWGAAYFAWLRHTGGKRIGGGIARSYYIGIEPAADATLAPGTTSVLCVVPHGLGEGEEVTLPRPELELALGQPVSFPLYTSTVRGDDQAGSLLQVGAEQLLKLPPLHTQLRGGKRSGTKRVPVTLAARSTEIGTLELWCVAKEGGNRWRLEFNTRDIVKDDPAIESSALASPVTDVWPEEPVQAAATLLRACYLEDGQPQELTRALEAALEATRHDWPTGLCRRLWEFLAGVADQRRRSPAHANRWFHLVGYCLRPGFGDPLDRFRVEQLWKLLHAPSRDKSQPRVAEGGADYWIMWRRVAGGLNSTLQLALFDRLKSVLIPGKGKAGFKPGANELAEMWRAAASLERLDVKHKELLGQPLLKQLRRGPAPTYAFWSVMRLGSRTLVAGPLNAVLHPQIVETWLDGLLTFEPSHDGERTGWAFCLAQLARSTGQRALDVSESRRQRVADLLRTLPVPAHWATMVEEVSEFQDDERSQFLGDALPIGLRLLAPES